MEDLGYTFIEGKWSVSQIWEDVVDQAPVSTRAKNILLRRFTSKAEVVQYIMDGKRLICLTDCGRKTIIEILDWLDLMDKRDFQVAM